MLAKRAPYVRPFCYDSGVKKILGKVTIFAVLSLTFAGGTFLVALWTVGDSLDTQKALVFNAFESDSVTATAYVVFDQETGVVIAKHNEEFVLPIASVTKILTAHQVYTQSNLDATTSITWADVNTEGDAGKLHPYETYSIRELTYPLLLESSNDAAATLARADSSLLQRMNEEVAALGLTHTHFGDTSGLSQDNVSTAAELAKLSRELFIRNQHIFNITRLSQFVGEETGWRNNNPVYTQEGYLGGKHGYTTEAGKTGIAFFDESLFGGEHKTIGYVVLHSTDLSGDISTLRSQVEQHVSVR